MGPVKYHRAMTLQAYPVEGWEPLAVGDEVRFHCVSIGFWFIVVNPGCIPSNDANQEVYFHVVPLYMTGGEVPAVTRLCSGSH